MRFCLFTELVISEFHHTPRRTASIVGPFVTSTVGANWLPTRPLEVWPKLHRVWVTGWHRVSPLSWVDCLYIKCIRLSPGNENVRSIYNTITVLYNMTVKEELMNSERELKAKLMAFYEDFRQEFDEKIQKINEALKKVTDEIGS